MYNKSSLSQINSFASEQGDFVPIYEQDGAEIDVEPEKQIFVLTGSQLQAIIESAIVKATEPLKRELEELWTTIDKIAQDAAHNSQRVKKLEYKEPQPLQKDRADMLRALILASGGKLPEKMARQKMHLSKQLFTYLLASMEDIELRPLETDRRHKLLVLK